MAVLTFEQGAAALIAAGFSGESGATMLAIGVRESHLDTAAHNPGSNHDLCSDDCGFGPGCCDYACESSWGLFQVNRCAWPQFPVASLATAAGSAAAAWQISKSGTDFGAWGGCGPGTCQDALPAARAAFGLDGGSSGNPITPAAAHYLEVMLGEFPAATNCGVFVCKLIEGTNEYSQHSWGNAVDLCVGSDFDLGQAIFEFAQANIVEFQLRTLCWQDLGGCTTTHAQHVHADFEPHCTGVPPCDGGPADNTCGATIQGGSGLGCDDPALQKPCGPCSEFCKSGPPVGEGCEDQVDPVTGRICCKCPTISLSGCDSCPGGGIGSLVGAIEGFFGNLGSYLKIAAGGVVVLVGGAVAIVGATGGSAPAAASKIASKVPAVRAAQGRRQAVGARRAEAQSKVDRGEANVRVRTVSSDGRERVVVARRRPALREARDDDQRAAAARSERGTSTKRSIPGVGGRRKAQQGPRSGKMLESR